MFTLRLKRREIYHAIRALMFYFVPLRITTAALSLRNNTVVGCYMLDHIATRRDRHHYARRRLRHVAAIGDTSL